MKSKLSSFSVVALLLGCANSPPDGKIPERSRAPVSFVCDWEGKPQSQRVIMDLILEDSPVRRADVRGARRAIESEGGRVLHEFHVAMLRADLDTGAVRRLIQGPRAGFTYAVEALSPDVHDVDLQIHYEPSQTVPDTAALGRLGAREVRVIPRRAIVRATVTDGTIPRIARLPGVQFVEALPVGCAVPLGAA